MDSEKDKDPEHVGEIETVEAPPPEAIFTKKKIRQFLAAGAVAIGGFSLGAGIGWSSPALTSLEEREDFGVLSDGTKTWIASIVTLGAFICTPIAGFCIEKFGRKLTIICFAPPYVLGWLLISFANGIPMLLIGRFVTGLCGGTMTLSAPIYITEIATDNVRATLGSAFMVMIILGTITTYGVGALLSWKNMSLFNAFPPAILLLCVLFVPESPIYLLSKGKLETAKKSLTWLRIRYTEKEIEEELEKMSNQVEESKKLQVSFKDLLGPTIWRPTVISMMLVAFNQLSGIQAVLFYAKEIVDSAGTGINSDAAAVLLGLAVIVASAFMDKAGRRTLLLASEIGMGLSFTAIGTFFYLKEQLNNNDDELDDSSTGQTTMADVNPAKLSWLPIAGLMVFIMSYAVGLGPLPRIVLSEIIPLHVKGMAASIAYMFNWILAFAVTKTFEDLRSGLNDSGFFWLYAGISFLGSVCIFFTVPETKGKGLEEIQSYFRKK